MAAMTSFLLSKFDIEMAGLPSNSSAYAVIPT